MVAPTETGPEPYNPGDEIAMWQSEDQGQAWTKEKKLTRYSDFNHAYVWRPRWDSPSWVMAIDGSKFKFKANASKHKTMRWKCACQLEDQLSQELGQFEHKR